MLNLLGSRPPGHSAGGPTLGTWQGALLATTGTLTPLDRRASVAHRLTGWNAIKQRAEQLQLNLTDDEIKKIITVCMKRAEKILKDNINTLHRLAGTLLEREILDSAEIDSLIRGEELPPSDRRKNGDGKSAQQPAPPTKGRAPRP